MTSSNFSASTRKRLAVTVALLVFGQVVGAQQTKQVARIGYLAPAFACTGLIPSLATFRQGLNELGYFEGRNVVIECRSADGKPDRLSDLAIELAQLKVDVIVAAGGESVARAAMQASQTIPIVMTNAADPVATGLVASLSRPGGNITGLVTISPELGGKRLEILKQSFPKIARVAVLTNPLNPEQAPRIREMQAAAQVLGVHLQLLEVRGPNDFDTAFSALLKAHAEALMPLGDPLINSRETQIVDFVAKNHLPAIYHRREFVDSGGLMSYGPNYEELFRRAASYVDSILRGARPGDIPIEQPTKFELVINLRTAKALGFTIPQSVLFRANRIVE
jgi:putative ABC transport system substrate-binding protein